MSVLITVAPLYTENIHLQKKKKNATSPNKSVSICIYYTYVYKEYEIYTVMRRNIVVSTCTNRIFIIINVTYSTKGTNMCNTHS